MAETPEDLRDRAEDVLSDPKFATSEPGLIDRLVEWVQEVFSDLLEFVTDSTVFGGVAVGWILLAAMIGLIVFFLLRYLPSFSSAKAESVSATVLTHKNRRTRAEWLAEAEAAERKGQHREAVRARYKATVAGLIEQDELPDTVGATATELRNAFRGDPSRSDPFSSSTGAFSDVWYGGDEADQSDAARVAGWDEQVVGKSAR